VVLVLLEVLKMVLETLQLLRQEPDFVALQGQLTVLLRELLCQLRYLAVLPGNVVDYVAELSFEVLVRRQLVVRNQKYLTQHLLSSQLQIFVVLFEALARGLDQLVAVVYAAPRLLHALLQSQELAFHLQHFELSVPQPPDLDVKALQLVLDSLEADENLLHP